MFTILRAQLQKLRRNPQTFIMSISLTIMFALILGANSAGQVIVYTFYDEMERVEAEQWLELLNRSESFTFELADEQVARKMVIDAKVEFALKLMPDDYRLLAAAHNQNTATLDLYVRSVMQEELMIRATESQYEELGLREELEERLAQPALSVNAVNNESDDGFAHDARVHSLFGFSLFFSINMIFACLVAFLYEKQNRIWDRVILSPVSKASMYAGHLSYGFLMGFVQITAVFILFRYGFNVPLGDSFGTILVLVAVYTFAIVALGMMLASIVKTPQQLSVLTPIIGVSFAMLGGAYWPIEIISNPILLTLSKFVPITYAMEALRGVAYYQYSWSELLEPVSYLVLFGVVCMGIGINLMERRSV